MIFSTKNLNFSFLLNQIYPTIIDFTEKSFKNLRPIVANVHATHIVQFFMHFIIY